MSHINKNVDLHMHSTASDGTLTPTQLVDRCKKIELSVISLTDHDTVGGIADAIAHSEKVGLEVIPGVEVTCPYQNQKVHILGYFIDYKSKALITELEIIRFFQTKEIVDHIDGISLEKLVEYATNDLDHCVQYVMSLANRLGANSPVPPRELEGYLSSYLSSLKHEYLALDPPSLKDCMSTIIKAGGIPVLAHPAVYDLSISELEEMVKELISLGLSGIEIIHPTISKELEVVLNTLVIKNNLCVTGGSDFHGGNTRDNQLGMMNISHDIANNLKTYYECYNESFTLWEE